jgi:hypothetical protein
VLDYRESRHSAWRLEGRQEQPDRRFAMGASSICHVLASAIGVSLTVACGGLATTGTGNGGRDASADLSPVADSGRGVILVADAKADGASLPSCTWPSSLPDQCVAARVFANCARYHGGRTSCLSNGSIECAGATGCTDVCLADEYAVQCADGEPHPQCRIPPGPWDVDFVTYFCCPCAP